MKPTTPVRAVGDPNVTHNILFAFADAWGRYASAYNHVDAFSTLIVTPNFEGADRQKQ